MMRLYTIHMRKALQLQRMFAAGELTRGGLSRARAALRKEFQEALNAK